MGWPLWASSTCAAERAVVGHEGIHPIALAVVGDHVLVDLPFEAPAALGTAYVAGVGPRPAGGGLSIAMLLGAVDLHLQPASHLLARQDRRDALVDVLV